MEDFVVRQTNFVLCYPEKVSYTFRIEQNSGYPNNSTGIVKGVLEIDWRFIAYHEIKAVNKTVMNYTQLQMRVSGVVKYWCISSLRGNQTTVFSLLTLLKN